MSQWIAERRLLYCPKGGNGRRPFSIRIYAAHEVKASEVHFKFNEGTAQCTVQFDGLPDMVADQTYGADSLQALQLAVDIEPILKRLSKKYDFYFPSGESYFEE